MKHLLKPIVFLMIVSLGACAVDGNRRTVERYVSAYNDQDLVAMAAMLHPSVEWISVEDGRPEVLTSGSQALIDSLRAHLAGAPAGNRSSLNAFSGTANVVAVTETAHWLSNDKQPRQQASLAVYEFDDGLIRRVWYYPAQ